MAEASFPFVDGLAQASMNRSSTIPFGRSKWGNSNQSTFKLTTHSGKIYPSKTCLPHKRPNSLFTTFSQCVHVCVKNAILRNGWVAGRCYLNSGHSTCPSALQGEAEPELRSWLIFRDSDSTSIPTQRNISDHILKEYLLQSAGEKLTLRFSVIKSEINISCQKSNIVF